MKILGLLLLLIFMSLAPDAQADETRLLSQAYWVDEDGLATLRDVMKAPFQEFQGSLTKGYSKATIWLRLRISGAHSLEPQALIVRPAFLRRIELYDPSVTSGDLGSVPRVSGRDADLNDTNHIGLDNGFIIAASAEPRDVFLRITTTTSLTAEVSLTTLSEADRISRMRAGAMSVYFAFLLAFCLWGCVNWSVRREAIYGLFVLRLVFSILHIFVVLGPLRYFFANDLEASTRDLIYSSILVMMPLTGLFDVRLLSEFGTSRRIQKMTLGVVALTPINLMFLLQGNTQTALHFTSMTANAMMLLILALAFSARDRDKLPYGRLAIVVIRAGFAILAAVVIVPMLMFQNILNSGVSMLNIFFTHAVISTIILFFLLSIRARQRDLQAEDLRLQYELKTQELQRENQRRVEKERFLSMLTHELRNPLTVVRLKTNPDSKDGQAIHKAVTDIANVIERVEQSEKDAEQSAVVQKTRFALKKFLEALVADPTLAERLDLNIPDDMSVTSDEQILGSIVRNLLDNAEKYSRKASRIRVSAVRSAVQGADGVTLFIANDVGEAGTPEADKVFTKYYRNKKAQRQAGSGLGLFLVAGWVKSLGGEVRCTHQTDPDERETVTFSVWVPG